MGFLYYSSMKHHFSEFSTSRIVIYTCIIGDYDDLRQPLVIDERCDYVCFTDQPPEGDTGVWQIRPLASPEGLDFIRAQRYHKFLPHLLFPEYDYSIYMDGNLQIQKPMRDFVATYAKDASFLCAKHPVRDCLYEEAEEVLIWGFALEEDVTKQIARYREEGFPAHYGLICANCLVRAHHDPALVHLMELWYHELSIGAPRDQLSFSYCVWKLGFSYDAIALDSHNNPFYLAGKHKKGHYILGPQKLPPAYRGLRGKLNMLYGALMDRLHGR